MEKEQVIAIMSAIIYAGEGVELDAEDCVEEATELYELSLRQPAAV